MTMKRLLKRIAVIFSAALLCVFSAVESFFSVNVFADSADVQEQFEQINVLDDLKADKSFNILNYPFRQGETPEMYLINVVEFCYSYKTDMQDDYGLYLYIYNPNGREINVTSTQNKASMAVAYDTANVTNESRPIDYEMFQLEYCSKSEGNYNNLFYKFKVIDHKGTIDGKTMLERVNANARRYDIAEMQFVETGENTAKAYPITGDFCLIDGVEREKGKTYGTFYFSGYAKGYGPDPEADSTLSVTFERLDTISLTLNHTFWRSETSALGAHHKNQIDTVYFAVPNEFFEQYGKLQRIKAEWYEYKTKDIIVTSNSDFYNTAKNYIGQENAGKEDDWGYGLAENYGAATGMGSYTYADWTWNNTSIGVVPNGGRCSFLYYLFLTGNISAYDPYKSAAETGGIQGSDLYRKMLEVSEQLGGEKIETKDGKLIAALFEDDIDDSRKEDNERGKIQKGYSYYDFDASLDIKAWQSWNDTNPSFWQNAGVYGLWQTMFGDIPKEEGKDVQPIYELSDSDFSGTAADISNNLMVNLSDVSALQSYYNTNKNDNHIIAFRFAVTDYYSAPIDIIDYHGLDSTISGQAYRAKESVFLDFNVIQLTFNDSGKYTVIPVVSDPIDIVNDIYSPSDFGDNQQDWWKKIFAILLVIVLLVVLMPVLPTLISVLVKIILLPFKLISAVIKGISKAFHKKE